MENWWRNFSWDGIEHQISKMDAPESNTESYKYTYIFIVVLWYWVSVLFPLPLPHFSMHTAMKWGLLTPLISPAVFFNICSMFLDLGTFKNKSFWNSLLLFIKLFSSAYTVVWCIGFLVTSTRNLSSLFFFTEKFNS